MADISELIAEARAAHEADLRRLDPPRWRLLARRRARKAIELFERLDEVADPLTDGRAVH